MSECSADTVRMAYRFFLNREPESDAVVEAKAGICLTYRELRHVFVSSPEFQSYLRSIDPDIYRSYWERPATVEVDVPRDTLEKLLRRTRAQWRELGQGDPYWSVLSHNDFRIKNIDPEKLTAFYETGRKSAHLIELFRERTGAELRQGVCFELGCGVGRVTAHLARQFDRVIAADISPGNLALCERYMREIGINNVQPLLLESPEHLLPLGPFDFFYSVIVLQHNPPPVQKVLLNNILSQIEHGGGCLFQTPANLPNYTFSSDKYLSDEAQVMDMHCLPKPVVLKVFHDNGLQIRDVEMDPWAGTFGSCTYFATK